MRFIETLAHDRAALQALVKELRIVALPGRSPEPACARLWFRAREAYFELFVDVRSDGISWWQLTLRGLAWTWRRESGRISVESTSETEVSVQPISASAILGRLPPAQRPAALSFCAALLQESSDPFIRNCGMLARASLNDAVHPLAISKAQPSP
jgi:hypothetical protein